MDGGIVSFVPRAYQNEAVMFKLREPVERSELRKECEWVRTKMTLWLLWSEKAAHSSRSCHQLPGKDILQTSKIGLQGKLMNVKLENNQINEQKLDFSNKKLHNNQQLIQLCFAVLDISTYIIYSDPHNECSIHYSIFINSL